MSVPAYAPAAFPSTSTSNFNSPVKASEYCNFLNQNAASDPDHLFDEKMAVDSEAACIIRLGTAGNYFYEVIAGRENFPVTYVSEFDEQNYCDAMDMSYHSARGEEADLFKSNRSNFSITSDSNRAQFSMFGGAGGKETGSFLAEGSFEEEVLAVMSFLMSAVVAETVGDISSLSERSTQISTLEASSISDYQHQEIRLAMDSLSQASIRPDFIPLDEIPGNQWLGEQQPLNLVRNEHGQIGHSFQGMPVAMAMSANAHPANYSESINLYRDSLGAHAHYLDLRMHRIQEEGITPSLHKEILNQISCGSLQNASSGLDAGTLEDVSYSVPNEVKESASEKNSSLSQAASASKTRAPFNVGGYRTYLEMVLVDALSSLNKIKQQEIEKPSLLAKAIETGERLIKYIENSKANEGLTGPTSFEIAAIDRQQEAFKMRILRLESRSPGVFSKAAFALERSAQFLINGLVALREGNTKKTPEYWFDFAEKMRLFAEASIKEPSTIQEHPDNNKVINGPNDSSKKSSCVIL